MNKITALGLIFLFNPVTMASATESFYYRYGDPNASPNAGGAEATYSQETTRSPYMPIQQMIVQQPTMIQQPAPAPHAAQYGFYRNKPGQAIRPKYIVGGNPYALPYKSSSNNQNSYYSSPVFTQDAPQRARKLYYAGLRTGFAGTFTKNAGSAVKPLLGVFAGTWINKDVRAEAEFDYHFKNKLKHDITYQQYDLGANIYYDLPVTQSGWQPFFGAGLWTVKKKTSTPKSGYTTSHSGWKLAVSASAGAAYPIDDHFSLSAMLRGRYIITNESIYNIEALLGASYSW